MKVKKILSLVITGALLVSMCPSVFAYDGYIEVTEAGGTGYSDITLTVENTGGSVDPTPPVDPTDPPVDPPVDPTDPPVDPPVDPTDPPVDPPIDPVLFSAYVPTQLPIKMNLQGNIAVPSNAKIINGVGSKGICVTAINVTTDTDWSIVDYSEDFTTKSADTHEVGMILRDDVVTSDGTVVLANDNWNIAKDSYIDLTMDVKIPKQTEAGSKGKIATIGFTLDWSGDDVSTGPSIPDDGIITPTPPVTPDETDKFTITYITDGNGSIMGNSTVTVDKDSTLTFPTVTANEGYIFDKWINSDTNEEVTTSTAITSNLTVKALFKLSETEKVSVTFISDENGSLEGTTSLEVTPGDTVSVFPTPKPITIAYMFDKWVNPVSNEEVLTTTPITSDLVIKAVFQLRPSNPSNWFTVDTNGNLTGVTDDYGNMADAPTDLVIPRQVGGVLVTAIADNAFKGRSALTSIVLPEGVTTIGMSAFEGCSSLTDISIPKSLTWIKDRAFFGCKLKEVNIPSTVTKMGRTFKDGYSSTNYANSAFANGCAILRLPEGIDVTNTIIGYNFDEIYLPKSIVEQNFVHNSYGRFAPLSSGSNSTAVNTKGANKAYIADGTTKIGANIFSFTSVANVYIPNSVTSISSKAFVGFQGTLNIDAPIGSISGAPWGATTNLRIKWSDSGDIDTDWKYTITSTGITLTSYEGLAETVVIPNMINGFKVIGISKLVLPEVVKHVVYSDDLDIVGSGISSSYVQTIKLSKNLKVITAGAFRDCTGLIEPLDIPDSVTTIGTTPFIGIPTVSIGTAISNKFGTSAQIFKGVSNVILKENVTSIGDYAFNGATSITSIVIPNNVTVIGANAFEGATSITDIKIPDNLTIIGANAFKGCSSLDIVEWGTSLETISSNAFMNCTALTSLKLPNTLKKLDAGSFNGCISLISVELPESLKTMGYGVFSNCNKLTDVVLKDGIEAVNLGDCVNVKTLIIPESVKNLTLNNCIQFTDSTLPKLPENLEYLNLSGCTGLTSLKLPNSIINLTLEKCTNLIDVTIPSNVEILKVKDCSSLKSLFIPKTVDFNSSTFSKCIQLESIILEEGIIRISGGAFSGNTSLKEIIIPKTVLTIGQNSFENCSSLRKVTILSERVEYMGGSFTPYAVFTGCSNIQLDIYTPKSLMPNASYAPWGATKATVNWLG